MEQHHDHWTATNAREELIRNTKAAAKLMRLLATFNIELAANKINGIKALQASEGIGLKEAKDAWELAWELLAA